jgi:hypothetical protein
MNKIFIHLMDFHPIIKMRYSSIDKKDISEIPEGEYCYTTIHHDMETGITVTKPCPYLKRHKRFFGLVKEEFNWCAYLNTGDDILLNDECKWCEEKLTDFEQ